MSGRVRKLKGLAGRSVPGARRDPETIEKTPARRAAGFPLASEPPTHLASRDAEIATQRVLREFGLAERDEEQARTLAKHRTQRPHGESRRHGDGKVYCHVPILSTCNSETALIDVGDDDDVKGDERSGRWVAVVERVCEVLSDHIARDGRVQYRIAEAAGVDPGFLSRMKGKGAKEMRIAAFFPLCEQLGLNALEVWNDAVRDVAQKASAREARRRGRAATAVDGPTPLPSSAVRQSSRPKG